MAHHFDIRVYYEDTDGGGLVYYANYLKFAERARTELLRTEGIVQEKLMREDGIAFVVRKCSIDFLRPAKLDDLLTIKTQVSDITRASVAMRQAIFRGAEKLVELDVLIAVINPEKGRVTRLPEPLCARLKKHT